MKYQGMRVYDCEVNENDWLDVRFSQEEKIEGETKKLINNEGKNQKLKNFLNRVGKVFNFKENAKQESAVDDSEFPEGESFERPYYQKAENEKKPSQPEKTDRYRAFFNKYGRVAAVVAVILLLLAAMRFIDNGFAGDVFSYAKTTYTSAISKSSTQYTAVLPSTSTVSVNEDGDIIFSDGAIVSSIEDGTVSSITDDSVTIRVNEHLYITYSGLSEILVQEGDVVSKYGALGRYRETAIVSLTVDGVKVTNVSVKNYTLTWLL